MQRGQQIGSAGTSAGAVCKLLVRECQEVEAKGGSGGICKTWGQSDGAWIAKIAKLKSLPCKCQGL